jgi:hypothetical protein
MLGEGPGGLVMCRAVGTEKTVSINTSVILHSPLYPQFLAQCPVCI